MKLDRVILNVRSPEALAAFYKVHLGMQARRLADGILLHFNGEDAGIELRQASAGGSYRHRREDRYWKIGITLPNVDIAVEQLGKAGIPVSEPNQFGEIGYMAHLADPEGFSIELLQHRFEKNRRSDDGDPTKPLGGGARIGQITFRTADLEGALAVYRDRLGMRLLSIQPVPDYGFSLYFLACTDETPPNPDLEAVANREWLWQRPYTTLEFQVFDDREKPFALPEPNATGFAGIVLSGSDAVAGVQDEIGGVVVLE